MLTNTSGTLCKILRTITIIVCSVEINVDILMFKLSNLLLQMYAWLKSGKITVVRISCLNIVDKIWAPESMQISLYKIMKFLA